MRFIKENKLMIILLVFIINGCKTTQKPGGISKSLFVHFDDNKLGYMGRVEKTDSSSIFFWPGSSVEMAFEGTGVNVVLDDERGDNYFNVIIDHDSIVVLDLDAEEKTYLLASNLKPGKHTVQLFKRTEWEKGETAFSGFQLYGTEVYDIKPKQRSIEFYGNSITSGYAVEDYSGKDSPDSVFTNNYNSYAAMTARHFDADYTCISKGGIGITVSWFPMIMGEMYDRLDPTDSESQWDFDNSTPDVVVINLLQNDSWLVNRPEFPEYKKRFGDTKPDKEFLIRAYSDFVKGIRLEYPESKIICMLGNMDITREGSIWPKYLEEAVISLNDADIHTLIVPFKNTPGHPRIEEQQMMADSLIHLIEKHHLFEK